MVLFFVADETGSYNIIRSSSLLVLLSVMCFQSPHSFIKFIRFNGDGCLLSDWRGMMRAVSSEQIFPDEPDAVEVYKSAAWCGWTTS